jgi:hypothetical protein
MLVGKKVVMVETRVSLTTCRHSLIGKWAKDLANECFSITLITKTRMATYKFR